MHGRVSGPSSLLHPEIMPPCGNSVPCHLRPEVRKHGRGVLWAGSDPCMTECLECSLARPVLAQSWSQTATDGAWYSTTALLRGRDRPQCLCVLRQRGSEPETQRTGEWRSPSQAAASPWRALVMRTSTVIRSYCCWVKKYASLASTAPFSVPYVVLAEVCTVDHQPSKW